MVKKYNNLYLTIGFHPEFANQINDDDLKLLEEKLKFNKIVGLGEIGLDYYYVQDNKDKQKEFRELVFRKIKLKAEDYYEI